MRFRSGDAEISYQVLGDGPPLILLHPFPAHHGIWLPVAEQLSSRYRCILPDLRGHGASQPGEGPAAMQKHAEDIDRLCRACDVERAVFAGSSIGGYILFEFWRRYRRRVRALILCGTRAQADSPESRAARLKTIDDVRNSGPAAFLDAQAERLVGGTTRRNHPDRAAAARAMMNTMTVQGITAIQQGMAERPDSVPTLATIDVPALILAGEEDPVSSPADAEMMARSIRGSRMVVLAQAGHYLVFEKPAEVANLMRQFLDDLSN
jgi:3-oxoadipate enol-lactonase